MSGFLLVAGFGSLLIAALLLLADQLRYKKTTGQVVGWTVVQDEGSLGFSPRIRYHTELGIAREFLAAGFVKNRPGPTGGEVSVRYNPTIPWLHGVNRWTHRWLPVVIFGVIGGFFIWFGSL